MHPSFVVYSQALAKHSSFVHLTSQIKNHHLSFYLQTLLTRSIKSYHLHTTDEHPFKSKYSFLVSLDLVTEDSARPLLTPVPTFSFHFLFLGASSHDWSNQKKTTAETIYQDSRRAFICIPLTLRLAIFVAVGKLHARSSIAIRKSITLRIRFFRRPLCQTDVGDDAVNQHRSTLQTVPAIPILSANEQQKKCGFFYRPVRVRSYVLLTVLLANILMPPVFLPQRMHIAVRKSRDVTQVCLF